MNFKQYIIILFAVMNFIKSQIGDFNYMKMHPVDDIISGYPAATTIFFNSLNAPLYYQSNVLLIFECKKNSVKVGITIYLP